MYTESMRNVGTSSTVFATTERTTRELRIGGVSYLFVDEVTVATYLLKRGYNRNVVNKQIRRAADIPRELTLQTKDINKAKRIPFITTFNPSLPHISHIIKKHFNLLLSSNRCKSIFQHPPVVAFQRSPNLRDLLVTAKLPSNSVNECLT